MANNKKDKEENPRCNSCRFFSIFNKEEKDRYNAFDGICSRKAQQVYAPINLKQVVSLVYKFLDITTMKYKLCDFYKKSPTKINFPILAEMF